MNYTIQHMGYTFDSIHPPSHYLKVRSKRMRKKLCVGEFLSLGYSIEMTFDELDDGIIDDMIDFTFDDPIMDTSTVFSFWDSTTGNILTVLNRDDDIQDRYHYLTAFMEKLLSTYTTNYNFEISLFHNV